MSVELIKTVERLLFLNKEGAYWDFKEGMYQNKADMLHDIICLANNAHHKGERYIIFGVNEDKIKKEFKVVSLPLDHKVIQSDIIDTLKKAHFSNGNFPDISVEELEINNKRISVLLIHDHPEARTYYLSKKYEWKRSALQAGAIYTRVADTNTAKIETASVIDTEKLWRQRFSLDMPTIDRLRMLLRSPNEWVHNPSNKYLPQGEEVVSHFNFPIYHKIFSEFQIELSESEEREGDVYSYFFPNHRSFWGTAYFIYHSTKIMQLEYVYCDEMRILLPVPDRYDLFFDDYGSYFDYYLLDNDKGLFLKFLNPDNLRFMSRGGYAPILLFNNKEEFSSFVEYAQDKKEAISLIEPKLGCVRIGRDFENNELIQLSAPFASRIKQFHEEWHSTLWIGN